MNLPPESSPNPAEWLYVTDAFQRPAHLGRLGAVLVLRLKQYPGHPPIVSLTPWQVKEVLSPMWSRRGQLLVQFGDSEHSPRLLLTQDVLRRIFLELQLRAYPLNEDTLQS